MRNKGKLINLLALRADVVYVREEGEERVPALAHPSSHAARTRLCPLSPEFSHQPL